MYRWIIEWLDSNRMWVTGQRTFERVIAAVGLELERQQMVEPSFVDVVLSQETTIPSGVSDVAIPIAVLDVPLAVSRQDGISLVHLENGCLVKAITGETIHAKIMLIVTATTAETRRTYHEKIDDLLMEDDALRALLQVKSRTGLYHLQANQLEAFSY